MKIPSPLEVRYARALAEGMAVRDLAKQESVTYSTMRGRLHRLYRKHNVRNHNQLIAIFIRNKFLTEYKVPDVDKEPTDKQKSILRLIAAGYNARDVGIRKNILKRGIEEHIDNLHKKYGTRFNRQLVALGLHRGWF